MLTMFEFFCLNSLSSPNYVCLPIWSTNQLLICSSFAIGNRWYPQQRGKCFGGHWMESISKLAQTPQISHSIPGQSRNLGKTSPNNFWPKLGHHLLLEKVFLTKISTPTTHRIASWLIQLKKINTLEKDKSTISPNVIKILWDRNLPKIMSTLDSRMASPFSKWWINKHG